MRKTNSFTMNLKTILIDLWNLTVYGHFSIYIKAFKSFKYIIHPFKHNCETNSVTNYIKNLVILTTQSILTRTLEHCLICSSCGIVLVTTTASKHALLIRDRAGSENIPWVNIA